MTLRARLAVVTAAAVAVAVLAVSVAAFVVTRRELYDELDRTLLARAQRVLETPLGPGRTFPFAPGGRFDDPFGETFLQVLRSDGLVLVEAGQVVVPVTDADLEIASGQRGAQYRSTRSDGEHLRVLTHPYGARRALQIARPLDEVDRTLRGLAVLLAVVAAVGIAGAGAIGFTVARRAMRPVERVTTAAERVAASRELSETIPVDRDDETGRLARAFNSMVAALAASREQQQRLVTDASHELRTPLTSLRTNIELLARARGMPQEQRHEVLADATAELAELTHLVGELVELATDPDALDQDPEPVRLDQLAERAVDRARRRSGLEVRLDATASVVQGRPALLERAISNLLDNACKWSPSDRPVEVTVGAGIVTVLDHGPGVPEVERGRVFDRFYRGRAAQDVPGSGLGLAIVRQIVELHGGVAFVEGGPDGGARVGFRLPEPTPGEPPPTD